MADDFTKTQAALEEIAAEQRERYRPKDPEPQTPAEEYAKQLAAARSKTISIDAGWLR